MEIYTDIEEAGKIIRERWNNKALRKKVEQSLNNDFPSILKNGPSGMIWRHVGTPDGEFARFLELNKIAQLNPICFEYVQDKFVASNFTKISLVDLAFEERISKKNNKIIKRQKIIDFQGAEGKKLYELTTLWGEKLVDFHHFFLTTIFPITKDRIVDMSSWLKRWGSSPEGYYYSIMSLALCHSIFFDDLDLLEDEKDFVNGIIIPAFEKIKKNFEIKPIIVKISKEGEHCVDPFWWCYSKKAETIMQEHIKEFKC